MVQRAPELPELVLADAAAWRGWLGEHGASSPGVSLVLARKGTTDPTSLTHDEALDEALCHGWIDGRTNTRDAATYLMRWTPRRPRSIWSARNVAHVARLTEAGLMTAAGLAEVDRARADGRWDAAYAGPATIAVPDDLAAALAADPAAQATFTGLTSQNRFAVLFRLAGAKRPETRARRLGQFVEMLARGDTPYPQRAPRP